MVPLNGNVTLGLDGKYSTVQKCAHVSVIDNEMAHWYIRTCWYSAINKSALLVQQRIEHFTVTFYNDKSCRLYRMGCMNKRYMC